MDGGSWQSEVDAGRLLLALVRHGQTAWNAERRFLGRTDVPLDAVGEAQAATLARAFPFPSARVYSSPLVRALATARALHPEPVAIPDLAEMSQGDLEGLLRDEALARFPGVLEAWLADPVTRAAPGGESLSACRDRALAAILAIARSHRGGEVVVAVTHQMVIASVSCTVAGAPLDRWREFAVPNTAMTLLSWDGTGFHLVARAVKHESVQTTPGPDRPAV